MLRNVSQDYMYSFKFHSNLCQQSVSHDAECLLSAFLLPYKVTGLPPFCTFYLHRRGETFQVPRHRNHPSRSKVPCTKTVVVLKNLSGVCAWCRNACATAFVHAATKSMRLRRPTHAFPRSYEIACALQVHKRRSNVRSLLPHCSHLFES